MFLQANENILGNILLCWYLKTAISGLTLRVKGRQLENAPALGLFPDARASQTDLATAAFGLWQAAVCLGPCHVLLGQGDHRRNVSNASYLSGASRGIIFPSWVYLKF